MKKDTVSIGNSGEYFVAAELERRGFTAAVPMSNTKDFDILAVNRETFRQVALQVKTNRGKGKHWLLNKKSEELCGENIYYVLISLNELEQPEFYIIESDLIAKSMKKGYQQWIQEEGKADKRHETPMRKFAFDVTGVNNILGLNSQDYKNKWDKLK
ncbi:MAG: hypothetical protein Q4B40_05880 [Clostridia bacterium]|nr:hypothetical protein [Clostridia bacterium]